MVFSSVPDNQRLKEAATFLLYTFFTFQIPSSKKLSVDWNKKVEGTVNMCSYQRSPLDPFIPLLSSNSTDTCTVYHLPQTIRGLENITPIMF